MRGEVASLNKIVVSSLPSRDLAWTTYKWYSRSSCITTHTLAQVNLAGWTCTCSIVVVIRCNVECWLLCNEFEFVVIKDDIDTGVLIFNVHLSIHWWFVVLRNTPVIKKDNLSTYCYVGFSDALENSSKKLTEKEKPA